MSVVVAEVEYQGDRYTVTQDNWDADAPYLDNEPDALDRLVWYMWTEGNYSCDCNRLIFMGLDDPESDESPPCGQTTTLCSLTLDGKDLLAETVPQRLAAIGLVGL